MWAWCHWLLDHLEEGAWGMMASDSLLGVVVMRLPNRQSERVCSTLKLSKCLASPTQESASSGMTFHPCVSGHCSCLLSTVLGLWRMLRVGPGSLWSSGEVDMRE